MQKSDDIQKKYKKFNIPSETFDKQIDCKMDSESNNDNYQNSLKVSTKHLSQDHQFNN